MPTQTFFSLNKEKQTTIYHAALCLFANTPYEKVSIQSIVEAANIPRGSFYQYFTDKEDLYLYLWQEIARKSIDITYKDNMDFLWNMLYSDLPEKCESTPWYNLTLQYMEAALSAPEYQFATSHLLPPDNLLESVSALDVHLLYPVLLRHIENQDLANTPENAELLAFLLSSIDLLSFELRKIKHCQLLEEFPAIQKILLTFYNSVKKKDTPFSAIYTTFHLLDANGLNLLLSPVQEIPSGIFHSKDSADLRLHFIIQPGSLSGTFPTTIGSDFSIPGFISDFDFTSDTRDHLFLEIKNQKIISCCLYTYHTLHSLGDSFTLIGTDPVGKKIVLIENGLLL